MANCPSSYRRPAYIWVFASILAAIMCPFGLYYSNWLEIEQSPGHWSSMSSFRLCLNRSRISIDCTSYLTFGEMYSTEWKAVTLMMGVGACLILLVALASVFGLCVRKMFNKYVVALIFCLQGLGGMYHSCSLILLCYRSLKLHKCWCYI